MEASLSRDADVYNIIATIADDDDTIKLVKAVGTTFAQQDPNTLSSEQEITLVKLVWEFSDLIAEVTCPPRGPARRGGRRVPPGPAL